ncbi:hypothetical protein WN55_05837 [Dufourea novaeangliae]|uniref:Uncharacterized protein n=1 Tax=Dufourea novaeangliae TaxID=178035 RepID=A0A154P0E0_DUFNO|nr:hypothetical protein WN55_05837 [Dufourea novaeangliae]
MNRAVGSPSTYRGGGKNHVYTQLVWWEGAKTSSWADDVKRPCSTDPSGQRRRALSFAREFLQDATTSRRLSFHLRGVTINSIRCPE